MITRDADNPYLECGAVVIDGTKIEGWYAFGSEGGVSGCGVFGCKGQGDHAGLYQCTRTYLQCIRKRTVRQRI